MITTGVTRIKGTLVNSAGEILDTATVTAFFPDGSVQYQQLGTPNGKFSVLAPDGGWIAITHVGYPELRINSENYGTGEMGVINLAPDYKELPEITITASKNKNLWVWAAVGVGLIWFISQKRKRNA